MRISTLLLPSLLGASLVALASPSDRFRKRASRWRTVSDKIIETLFGLDETEVASGGTSPLASHPRPPQHTFARYGGDVLLRFNVTNAEEMHSLVEATDTLLLDIWEFSRNWVDIRLSKDILPSLLSLLPASLQHSHTPLLCERDLAQAILATYPASQEHDSLSDYEPPFTLAPTPSRGHDTNLFFQNYQPLSVMYPWLRFLASFFSTHVTLVKIGVSYQGRDILGLRVGVHPTNNDDLDPPKRKTVLITGGVRAREWITTSTVNYVAWSLITSYGKTPSISKLLEEFDFVFVPTVNPDGYVYTWETDRLWRKNRQQTSVRFCPGVDIDRSFGFQWDGASTTAGNPCSESFAGETPFEAVESAMLAAWARNETEQNNATLVAFVDLHSYSQQILYPYSYSCSATPPNTEDLEELALGLEKAIRLRSGLTYETMQACHGNYMAGTGGEGVSTSLPRMEAGGGSALDWFRHELRVKYAYQIKLRDQGTYGFLLPKENIVPTGREVLDAVLYLGLDLKDKYSASIREAEPTLTKLELSEERQPREEEIHDRLVFEGVVEEPQWELKRRRRR